MDRRIPSFFGSTLLLFGAFVIGEGLHRVFIQGTLAPTSLPFVVALAVGGLLLYAGWRLENKFDPSTYVPDAEDEDEESAEFDESMSPIDADQLAGRDRDDSYDGQ
jgi:hypothetical protein